ncbi:unnamed protein product [Rotaria sordida]|uniref:Uncharacterized protein n=1 Tax=Rotaria sordida TaxID=392033 RepID=A0A814NWG1_9BILA|nr:unnamed protein product [Rotaria sordida]CAF3828856.1 unnamed protein product [Rotaria sordida]
MLGLDPRQGQSAGLNYEGSVQHVLTVGELSAHQHDKGSLQILNNGVHTHTYVDSGHNHGDQTGNGLSSLGPYSMDPDNGGLYDNERQLHIIPMVWTPLRGSSIDISEDAQWEQHGVIVAGGYGEGNGTNQFKSPEGLFVDDEENLYIADELNHRIIKWKAHATIG